MKTMKLLTALIFVLVITSCNEEPVNPHYTKPGAKQSKVPAQPNGHQQRPVNPFEK